MHSRVFLNPTSFLLASALLLSGCGMGAPGSGSAPGAALEGRIIGGQQPVTGSIIQLYAASTGDYGAFSQALISSTIRSGDGGSFSISTKYTCPSDDTQVYLVAKGGNPGLPGDVDSAAITLMAALGPCGALRDNKPFITVNEVTTVAAAWALAPFAPAFDHIATSTQNTVGLANAFGMAKVLASSSRGTSPGDTPNGALVDINKIYTLANVLAACVNTNGSTAADMPCGKLFTAATPPIGDAPQNTADAALNIVRNPSRNIGDLLPLSSGTAPFQPSSSSVNDWTASITFPIGARTTSGMAFDSVGQLWVVAPEGLYELSPQGEALNSFSSMAGNSVAIDATGNIWVTTAANALAEMPSTLGSPTTHNVANGASSPGVDGLAIDGNGSPWYTCDTCTAVYKLNPSNDTVATFPVATGGNIVTNLSVDTSENVWLGRYGAPNVNYFHNDGSTPSNSPVDCGSCGHPAFVANDGSGNTWIVGNDLTRLTPSSGLYANYEAPSGGLLSPFAVAIDGAGNAWVSNTATASGTTAGSISEFTNAGDPVSPQTGYISNTLSSPQSIAVDGSGNVWVRNTSASTVTVFVGAGVPVVTPLALGVANGTLGTKP